MLTIRRLVLNIMLRVERRRLGAIAVSSSLLDDNVLKQSMKVDKLVNRYYELNKKSRRTA